MNNFYSSNLRYSQLSAKGKFLLWWMLYIFGYFNNMLTNQILPNRDVSLVLNFVIGIYAYNQYKYRAKDKLLVKKNTIGIWLLMAVMFISPIVPMLDYGQPYLNTIVSQRFNYAILFVLVLLAIKPKSEEMLYIMKTGSRISVVLFVIGVFFPWFFMDAEALKETMMSRSEHNSTDIGFGCPGFGLMVMYFYFCCGKLTQNPRRSDIIEMMVILAVIIAVQNRGTLEYCQHLAGVFFAYVLTIECLFMVL